MTSRATTVTCAGWPSVCPLAAISPSKAACASNVRRRHGEPWRCVDCAHRRVGELRRGTAHWQAAKTHCPRGHEYTPENTKLYAPPGQRERRYCKACKAAKKGPEGHPVSLVATDARRCA